MGALAILVVGGLVLAVLWSWLARSHGRSIGGSRPRGSDPLGWRSAHEIVEDREALEAEDLTQMLEASNERRRRRGEPERSVEDLELLVSADVGELRRRREAYLADRELDQLLEATNARRRARGLPERTREDARREYGGNGPAA
jgi:hypothetical protein